MSAPQQWKVLFIDDEPGIRNVTQIALEDSGYAVETAEDGQQGWRSASAFSPIW